MKRLSQAALLISLLVYCVKFYRAGIFPSVGTDSLIYHLTIPAKWLHEGYLARVELPFHDSAAEHSPMLSETFNYALMAMRGDASLVWIVQPVFLLLTFRFFYLSARLLGSGREGAMVLTAALTLFVPFVEKGVHTSNNELVLTCGCAWMLYGVLLQRLRAQRSMVHACCGAALMLATKYVAVIYLAAGLPMLLLGTGHCLRRGWGDSSRTQQCAGIAVVVIAAAVGLFFYVRNWVLLGNPVYPAEVRLAGVTVFSGLYDPSPLIAHGWQPAVLAKMLLHSSEDFAVQMPAGVLLWTGLAVSLVLSLLRIRRGAWLPVMVVVVFPALSLMLYFLKVPFWKQHRLLFPVYYTLWLSAAYAAGRLGSLKQRRLRPIVLWGLVTLFLLHLGLVAGGRLQRFFYAHQLTPAMRDEVRRGIYAEQYGSGGRAWNRLDELTRGEPAVIAYSGTATIFPLFGPELKNRVAYVPVGPKDRPVPVRLVAGDSIYHELAVARRRDWDARFWLDELSKRRVEYLYLVDNEALGGTQQELAMIAGTPESFELLWQEENVRIYRVGRLP